MSKCEVSNPTKRKFTYIGRSVFSFAALQTCCVFSLTSLGELEAIGDVDNLLVLVKFERGRAGVVVPFHLKAERRVSLRRIHVEQSTCPVQMS